MQQRLSIAQSDPQSNRASTSLRRSAAAPRHRQISLAVALAFTTGTGLAALASLPGNALAQTLPTGGQVAAGAGIEWA